MSDEPSAGADPDESMAERTPRRRVTVWLLVGADRRRVALVALLGFFLVIVAGGLAHPTPAYDLLTRGDPTETLYQALVSSTITGVTLVLTIGQLVLSQELGSLSDQRDRMTGAVDFRGDVADAVGAQVGPAEPSAFLRALVRATGDRADALAAAVDGVTLEGADDGAGDDGGDGDGNGDGPVSVRDATADEFHRTVATYVDRVRTDADMVAEQLRDGRFGQFDVVSAALDYDYSRKLYDGRRLASEFDDRLDEPARDELSELLSLLELFGPAREHFKTLYFRWALSDLSRALVVSAVPALAVAVGSLLFLDPRGLPGSTLGVNHALLAVASTATVSVVPFALLLAYVLRLVTVAKRTLSVGPFVLRETDRDAGVDWE
jgi:hypothetical protein